MDITIVERTEERGTVFHPRTVAIREFHADGKRVCAIPDGASTAKWQAALDLCKAAGFDYSEASRRAVDVDQRALCYSIISDVASAQEQA